MTRLEKDSLGHIAVAVDRLWGAQTQRSLAHFAISTERMPDELIRAFAIVKRAAAETNMQLGSLDKKRGKAIVEAVTHYQDYKLLAEISKDLGEPMVGINISSLEEGQKMAGRGW